MLLAPGRSHQMYSNLRHHLRGNLAKETAVPPSPVATAADSIVLFEPLLPGVVFARFRHVSSALPKYASHFSFATAYSASPLSDIVW